MNTSQLNSNMADLPEGAPSICIPRVFKNISWKRIKDVFMDLNLGYVERVDVVPKTTDKGESYNRVFVHFKSWNKDQQAVRKRLLSGDSIKILYEDPKPWFWKCSASRVPRPTPPPVQRENPHSTSSRIVEKESDATQELARLRKEIEQLKAQVNSSAQEEIVTEKKRKLQTTFSEVSTSSNGVGEEEEEGEGGEEEDGAES